MRAYCLIKYALKWRLCASKRRLRGQIAQGLLDDTYSSRTRRKSKFWAYPLLTVF